MKCRKSSIMIQYIWGNENIVFGYMNIRLLPDGIDDAKKKLMYEFKAIQQQMKNWGGFNEC